MKTKKPFPGNTNSKTSKSSEPGHSAGERSGKSKWPAKASKRSVSNEARSPYPEKSTKAGQRSTRSLKFSKFAKSESAHHERSDKPKWPDKASKTSKYGESRSPLRDLPDKKEKHVRTERPARRGKVSFYTPKTFKGAHSKNEEAQLSEGTVQRIALEILNAFEETHERVDHLLQQSIHKNVKLLEAREKGNLSKTVLNIIRWKIKIDYIISKSLKRDAESLDITLKSAYRLATFNVVWMNKSAEKCMSLSDFAIPKEFGKNKETVRDYIKFLNKAKKEIPYPNPKKNPVNALSISYSHPVWLIEKWLAIYGEETAAKICEFNNAEPALTLRVNTLKTSKKEVSANLEREGFQVSSCKHAGSGLDVTGRGEIFSTQSFQNGEFEIQDESSQLFADWCDPQPNHTVIDACAGSGGKTLYFSAAMHNKGKILATDLNTRSLEKLRKRATRAGSTNIEVCDLHSEEISAHWKGKADKVIIDAPCSGLGVLARNPDIKWRFDPEDFPRLVAEQFTILTHFAQFVKAGGELIYGTCTLNPDENENVIRHFLSTDTRFKIVTDHPARFKPFLDENGFFGVKPFEHGLSGFFGCKLIRK